MERSQPEGDNRNLTFSRETIVAALSTTGIVLSLGLRFGLRLTEEAWRIPLIAVLIIGGIPVLWALLKKLFAREFGSDLLAGISILTAAAMGEYLVGAIIVLMLSGGEALEQFATRRASSVLDALARRMPLVAHRKADHTIVDIRLDQVAVGDHLLVLPHEICPVDGEVIEGNGVMNEAYLTGEPFELSKTPGSKVVSGAVNGEMALTIVAEHLAEDSRYAKIMRVMEQTQEQRPRLRRLGDMLGAWYTPLAVLVAVAAWLVTGNPERFLAVVVIATPCPLILAIPVAVIGAISLSARHSIIIKNPAALEQLTSCRTLIFDKTGTLTYGEPTLTEIFPAPGIDANELLRLTASLEKFSRHPLAGAVVRAAAERKLVLDTAEHIAERPGTGLVGTVAGRELRITGRGKVKPEPPGLPVSLSGLECLVFLDGAYAGALCFHDAPRLDTRPFVQHLKPLHRVNRVLLVSGDRESEVRYLASQAGITEIYAGQTPEQKVVIVQAETKKAQTLFVGDGINDAPALVAATVGVAFGPNSDITTEAADAVILTASLGKVDTLLHISHRMRTIALQSAVGGMAVSAVGMGFAALGYLPPVEGAILQELIDLAAVLNAVRVALPRERLTDF